jgi:Fic family protein
MKKVLYEHAFARIPQAVFDDLKLLDSYPTKLLLVLIARQTVGFSKTWDRMSVKFTAKLLGCCPASASRYFRKLLEKNFIEKKKLVA